MAREKLVPVGRGQVLFAHIAFLPGNDVGNTARLRRRLGDYRGRSAELYAEAQLRGRPDDYQSRLEDEILSELRVAARLSERFYRGQIFGSSVLEQMVELTANSGSFRRLMSDLFAGTQGYTDLRARLSRMLPAVMGEGLASKLGWPPESRWLAGRSSTELA
jgi:hypothetical protein